MSAKIVKGAVSRSKDEEVGVYFEDEGKQHGGDSPLRGSKSSLGFYLESEQGKITKPPADILPPTPKPARETVRTIPFLFTPLAKKAFSPSDISPVNRPISADIRRRRKSRQMELEEQTSRSSTTKWDRQSKGNDSGGLGSSNDRVLSSRLSSGRTSAPPMMMSVNESFASAANFSHGIRDSIESTNFHTKKRLKKKTPDLFIIEAEQRAIEGMQKAVEREEFLRKKSELEMYISKLATQYNDLKKTRVDMEKQHAALQEQKAEVSAVEEGLQKATTDGQKFQQLQDLESKLDYWTLALHEEENYTRTLQYMQNRSSSDKHTRETETADFLKLLQNYDHDLSALVMRLQAAKNERASAEKRVLEYMDQIELYRERRDVRLNQRKREVHKLQLKDAALKRLIAEEEALNAKKNAINQAASQAAFDAQRQKEMFYNALNEGFGKIMSVTGVQSVEELAESFIHRQEKTNHFQAMLDSMKNRIDELTTTRQDLEKHLLKIKFSGSANDAESDEVEEVLQNLSKIRRRIADRKMKLAGLEALLIKVKSGFEYLASKFSQDLRIEMETAQIEPVEKMAATHPVTFSDEGAGQAGQADHELEDTREEAVRRRAMRRVEDPRYGVVALMNDCIDRLTRVYRFLEVNTQGVPPQRLEDAEVVSISNNVLLRLDESAYNLRVQVDEDGFPVRDRSGTERPDEGQADEEEFEDRCSLKTKAEKLVARKKRELAARFNEFGEEIVPKPKTPEKKK